MSAPGFLGGALVSIVSAIIIIAGVLVCFGYLTRLMALIGVLVFVLATVNYQWYMLTYINYLGEMILFLIIGGGLWSVDHALLKKKRKQKTEQKVERVSSLEKYSFFILRLLFGLSLIFASFYAKFLHSNLALQTVTDYHLTNYFHFSPLFLVLGAFLVEITIGLCYILGFQIRLASIVFTCFLIQSILFFGEAVWPHIILFGVNFALFAHGYDKYTLGKWFSDRVRTRHGGKSSRLSEPVL